jgi:hypothetical protein
MLPAGSYQIQASANLSDPIHITSDTDKQSALIPVITRISTSKEDQDSAAFDVIGNDHHLNEIYLQGEDGYLVKSTTEKHTHSRVQRKK